METAVHQTVFEFTHYSVKPDQRTLYQNSYPTFKSKIEQLDGLISRISFQSIENQNDFLDFILWKSEESIEKASKTVTTQPEFSVFFATIEQTIFFKKATLVYETITLPVDKASHLGLFIYTVKPDKINQFEKASQALTRKAQENIEGFCQFAVFESYESKNTFIDAFFYTANDQFDKQHKRLETTPEFIHYIQCIEELKIRKTFKRV